MLTGIETRTFAEADYILKNKSTVRNMAKLFGVSKSTIHYDLTRRLRKYNYNLFLQVKEVLKYNMSQRHIRGGLSTQKKYKKLNKMHQK